MNLFKLENFKDIFKEVETFSEDINIKIYNKDLKCEYEIYLIDKETKKEILVNCDNLGNIRSIVII